jgi:hypothetical protein
VSTLLLVFVHCDSTMMDFGFVLETNQRGRWPPSHPFLILARLVVGDKEKETGILATRLRATNCGMHCIHRTNPL